MLAEVMGLTPIIVLFFFQTKRGTASIAHTMRRSFHSFHNCSDIQFALEGNTHGKDVKHIMHLSYIQCSIHNYK